MRKQAKTALRSMDRGMLYEGYHTSFRQALEQAVTDNVVLTGLDARHQDLRQVNLDGVTISKADFQDSDLSGANLSEAVFQDCSFSGSTLFDACFCYSDLRNCKLLNARFGMTDFSQSNLHSCFFSGSSLFSLDLKATQSLEGSSYLHRAEKLNMSKPPLTIRGLKTSVVILDDKILIESEVYDFNRNWLKNLSFEILASVENKFLNSTIC